jgi:hypothetical protein
MTFISSPKLKAKHDQTPLDIYYSNLEEAYGNLPVPADDYAEVFNLIEKVRKSARENGSMAYCYEQSDLEFAIETIQSHYEELAVILRKEQKYG